MSKVREAIVLNVTGDNPEQDPIDVAAVELTNRFLDGGTTDMDRKRRLIGLSTAVRFHEIASNMPPALLDFIGERVARWWHDEFEAEREPPDVNAWTSKPPIEA